MSKKTLAVVGASTDRSKYGNKCVRAYQDHGWEVYPVNPRAETIEGLECYPDLAATPSPLDRVSVYLPPKLSLELVPELAAKEIGEVWFNPGAADAAVLEAARSAGVNAISGCSIVDIGTSPARYPG